MAPVRAMKEKRHDSFKLKDKIAIISELEAGKKQSDIAKEKNISKSTVQGIWKTRSKIKEDYGLYGPNSKRARKSEFPRTDEALVQWLDTMRHKNLPISGPFLLEKAKVFAKNFNESGFTGTNGWLEKWKKRHNIKFYSVSGEGGAVNSNIVDDWLENVWPNISRGYRESDIFNCDETGLFYKLLPNKTMSRKGKTCTGGKLSKERITLMLCCNADGSEKLKPLIIGKVENPSCFKNIKKKSLPVDYYSNTNAWMTKIIFETWLKKVDLKMRFKRRKILLLLDNCGPHKVEVKLANIKLVFLPPNVTAKLQPLDQGIINQYKANYRRGLIRKYIQMLEKNEEPKVDLLDAILKTGVAWSEVTCECIANCFKHSKIINAPEIEVINEVPTDEDKSELAAFEAVLEGTFDDYVQADNELATCAHPTAAEIIAGILDPNNEIDNEESDGEDDPEIERCVPSSAVIKDHLDDVMLWLLNQDFNEEDDGYQALLKLQRLIHRNQLKNMKQLSMDKFVTQL